MEKEIKWANGTAVQGNNAQRNYPLATSQKYTIDPTLGGHDWKGHNVYLWVIWAKVTIDDTGTDPPNAPPLPTKQVINGQALGLQYDKPKDAVDFTNCQIAKMTPTGIHNVIAGGCVMKQQRMSHDFQNGLPNPAFFNNAWVSDGPPTGDYTTKPDSADNVYAIDGPNDKSTFATNSYDTYNNFRDWIEWNGIKCSSDATWYFQAGMNTAKTPEIYFAAGGSGQITLPNTDPGSAAQ